MIATPPVQQRLLNQSRPATLRLRLATATGFFAGALFALQAVLISIIVDRVFLQRQSLPDVAPLFLLLLAMLLARAIAIWAGDVLAQHSASLIKASLRQDLSRQLLARGPAYANTERSGELVQTAVGGIESLDDYITQFLPARTLAVLVPGLVFLLVLLLDPPTTLVLLFAGPMLILMLALIGGRARAITERRFLELSWMSAFFLDVLQGLPTLKMFGRSEEQAANIEEISQHYGRTTMEVLATAFQTSLVMEWAATAATAMVALETSLRLMNGGLPFSEALAVLLLTPEFFLPLRQMALRYHAGTAGKAAAERIFAILDAPAVAPATPGISSTLPPAAAVPARFDIQLDDIYVSYPALQADRTVAGQRDALRGLSLAIPHGQTVALVGPTGAGKTTVSQLLLRFVQPQAGTITVSGVPLAAIDPTAWRSQLAWVPQQPYLFHGTILDNIRLGRPDAGLDAVVVAARAAHIHDFVAQLPLAYDTPVGERGVRLSGGQRQRIAIARAFLKDAPCLILDEVTAHLDAESETLIHDALRRLMAGRTVLLIAHRLKLAYAADQIVVLDQGRAVQTGPHRTLLERDGLYRQLVLTYETVGRP